MFYSLFIPYSSNRDGLCFMYFSYHTRGDGLPGTRYVLFTFHTILVETAHVVLTFSTVEYVLSWTQYPAPRSSGLCSFSPVANDHVHAYGARGAASVNINKITHQLMKIERGSSSKVESQLCHRSLWLRSGKMLFVITWGSTSIIPKSPQNARKKCGTCWYADTY